MNTDNTKQDLLNTSLFMNPSTELYALLHQFIDCISYVADKHAPLRKKTVTVRPYTPWCNEDIENKKKREKRKAEANWTHTRIEIESHILCQKRNKVAHLIRKAKIEFYNQSNMEYSEQKKALFQVVNKLLHKSRCSVLPTHTLEEYISNVISAFFENKINKIRKLLTTLVQNLKLMLPRSSSTQHFYASSLSFPLSLMMM